MNDKTGFSGILPAVASPCNEKDVFLEEKFADLVTMLYKEGVHGLYVCGATGDGYNMMLEERKKAAEIAVEISRKYNGKVIVHVGCSNTRDAMELAEHAAKAGAAAVASIPPVNRSQSQLVSYYTDVARACQIPVFVYHIPALTHRASTLEEMLELLDIEGVIGLKLTDWNLFFMKRLLNARPDIKVFSGYDEFLCPGLLYGADGGIGTWYNLFPKIFLGIYNAVGKGNIKTAMELQDRFLSFVDFCWKYGAIQIFELIMRQKNIAPYCFRRPHSIMDREILLKISPELEKKIAAIDIL